MEKGNDSQEVYNKRKHGELAFIILACVFAGGMAVSACIGSKLVNVFGLTASATVLAYSITFLMTDVISEVWGKKRANKIVFAGFVAIVIGYLLIKIAIVWPAAPFWAEQAAFEKLFGVSLRIIVGGLIAYLVSQFHDVWAFHFWRGVTKGKHLWLRNNLSTLVSQFIDTTIFATIAFYGITPLMPLILGHYVVKVGIALLDTPFAYLLVWLIRGRSACFRSTVSTAD